MAKKSTSEQEVATSQDEAPATETFSAPETPDTSASRQSASDAAMAATPDILDEVTESDEEIDAGATREADALPLGYLAPRLATSNPNSTIVLPPGAATPDSAAPNVSMPDTISSSASTPGGSASSPSSSQPTPTRRYPTLAGAFNRARLMEAAPDPEALAPGAPDPEASTPEALVPETLSLEPLAPEPDASFLDQPTELMYQGYDEDAGMDEGVADEVDPDIEWAIADQPTMQLSPEELQALRPSFLEPEPEEEPEQPSAFLNTGELQQPSWPPRPSAAPMGPTSSDPRAPGYIPRGLPPRPNTRDWRSGLPPRPQPPFPLPDTTARPAPRTNRLERPDGQAVHRPDINGFPSSDDSARTARLKQLRRDRVAHGRGEAATDDVTPVVKQVQQWWGDLRGNVGDALEHQRELRESGTHPLPAYTPTQTRRLGDAFGRLAASARGISERAQHAVGPAFKAIQGRAQGIKDKLEEKLEGDSARQQAPLLGPGRIAIFFRRGVSVGQAQRLLAASSARPMRLIPRKHGILAQVMPGLEPEIGERLRQHPYVDDVLYMEYLDKG